MVNVQKIKDLAKSQGISLAFICADLGIVRSYFHNVAYGKTTITDDRLERIARILHTTPEYLKDETEDPSEKKNRTGETDAADPVREEIIDLIYRLNDEAAKELLDVLKATFPES